MNATVAKWGNSLALRIPRETANELSMHEGRTVDLTVEDGALVVRTVTAEGSYTLDDLLAGITEENLHAQVETGAPSGNEVW